MEMERGLNQTQVSKIEANVYSCPMDFFTRYGYTSVRVLGKGMMGEVVLSQPPTGSDNQQMEAVKTFTKKTMDGGKRNGEIFLQEVAIIQSLKHKHIIGNIQAFECPGEYIMCMPYYKEGTLREHLSRLTIDRTDKYLLQLTCAVLYLHARHLAHRDIKPSNILISDDGDVILTDFGLARVVRSRSLSGVTASGSDGYIAPELEVRRPRNINLFKCDMYSLGVVLWNMLFQRSRADEDMDYLSSLMVQSHIPASYETVLENLLHPDPELRWDADKLMLVLSHWPSMTKHINTFNIVPNNVTS